MFRTKQKAVKAMLQSSYLASNAALTHLTHLQLQQISQEVNLQLLPVQLQQLDLEIGRSLGRFSGHTSQLQLGHLTNLQQLSLLAYVRPRSGSTSPAQLKQLKLHTHGWKSDIQNLKITQLQELEELQFWLSGHHPQDLLSLTGLQKLQHLVLDHEKRENEMFEARVWKQLSQLHELRLDWVFEDEEELLSHLADLTSDTKVSMCAASGTRARDQPEPGEEQHHPQQARVFSESLAAMTWLYDPDLTFAEELLLQPRDLEPLSALTNLAGLSGRGVNSEDAELATVLAPLQWLQL